MRPQPYPETMKIVATKARRHQGFIFIVGFFYFKPDTAILTFTTFYQGMYENREGEKIKLKMKKLKWKLCTSCHFYTPAAERTFLVTIVVLFFCFLFFFAEGVFKLDRRASASIFHFSFCVFNF
jgi:hypothetical protein